MLDKVTSHNREMMPLYVRFVAVHKNVQEEFIQFSTLSYVRGEAIATYVCSDLQVSVLNSKHEGAGVRWSFQYVKQLYWCTGIHKEKISTSDLYPPQWTMFEFGH